MTKKIVLITEIISPYRIPVFNEIAKQLGIQFEVFFMADTVPGRSWDVEREKIRFKYRVLKGIKIPLPERFPLLYNPEIKNALSAEDPDIIVCGGYHHPTSLLALWYAKKHRKRFILWCESHRESVRLRNFPVERYRKFFVASSDGFIVPGKNSFDFIRSFGVREEDIWTAPNAINTALFQSAYAGFKAMGAREEFRRMFHLPEFNILYVGRLAPEKGLRIILNTLGQIQKRGHQAGFVMVGDGPQREEYENLVRKMGLKHVVFTGFKQQKELAYYYAACDVLALPSYSEPWGLVVNEALTCGLPVLCSREVGCAADLIIEGKTGFICKEVSDYDNKITQLMTNEELAAQMREHCLNHITQFTPERSAEGFINLFLSDRSPKMELSEAL